ncbi:hypothetical protein Cma02nite_22950 [Cellulomonas marina]|nr:hypothetical protein Cma02nite_22950 [Cellulomonas marina]
MSGDLRALDDLIGRIGRGGAAPMDDATVQGLATANEELRVADEELRLQREQIARLLAERRAAGLQRQWLASMLPVPMVVTDRAGVVVSANAAAGQMLHIALAHLVRKPLPLLVHEEDRPQVRSLLGSATASGDPVRLRVRLLPRRSEPVVVDLAVTSDGWTAEEGELAWTFFLADESRPAAQASSRALALAGAFADMCWLPARAGGTQELLSRIADVTHRAVAAAEAVSVNLGSAAEPTAVASTSELAAAFDGAQVLAGTGPCVTASEAHETVVTGDVAADSRWAGLARTAAGAAVVSVLAVPVTGDEGLVGAVNLYSTRRDAFTEEDVDVAELLAAAGGAVLVEVAQKDRLRTLAAQLDQALTSRAVIDEAKGIIMARRGGTADEAFAFLSALSQQRNVKLRVLATALVEQTAASRPAPPAPAEERGANGAPARPGVSRRRS